MCNKFFVPSAHCGSTVCYTCNYLLYWDGVFSQKTIDYLGYRLAFVWILILLANTISSSSILSLMNRTYVTRKASLSGIVDSYNYNENYLDCSKVTNALSISWAILSIRLDTDELMSGMTWTVSFVFMLIRSDSIIDIRGKLIISPTLCGLKFLTVKFLILTDCKSIRLSLPCQKSRSLKLACFRNYPTGL